MTETRPAGADLDFAVDCPCGCWHWRELRGASGPVVYYDERYCPRCRRSYLIVMRGEELLGIVRLNGRHVARLRSALLRVQGLTPREAERLVHLTARSEGRRRPPGD